MDRIVGVSDGANAALHALALAARDDGATQAKQAAAELGVSPSYLAKVLQRLAGVGLIASTRGIGGGFSLTRPADTLTCMQVLDALEGPLPARECLFEKAVCRTGTCAFKVVCDESERRLREALERATVADLSHCFAAPAAARPV